jgi:uncharacterized membrane protein YkvA (DUF1232 family)
MKKRKPAPSSSGAKPAKPAKKRASKKPLPPEKNQLRGDEVTESAAFRRAALEAEAYLRDPARLRKLVQDAVAKVNIIPRGPFGEAWPYLLAMIRVVRDYQRAEFRDMAPSKLLSIVATLIYFVSPFDVIPDWLPVLGHIDDSFVVTLALKSIRADLDAFMAWETARI